MKGRVFFLLLDSFHYRHRLPSHPVSSFSLAFMCTGTSMCPCMCACVHVCCMLKHRGQWLILGVFLNHLPSHFLWQGLSVNLELRTLSLLTSEFQGSTCLLPPSRSNRVTGSHHHASMGSRDLRGSPQARTDCRQFTDWAVCQVDTSLLTKTPRQVYLRMRSNYYPSFTLIKFVYDYSPTHSKAWNVSYVNALLF